MKRNRSKKAFLERLRKGDNVSNACNASNISRQTVYRWQREDLEFKDAMEIAITEGDEYMNDFVENQAKKLVQNGDRGFIKFWLEKRNPKFKANSSQPSEGEVLRLKEEIERLKKHIEVGKRTLEEAGYSVTFQRDFLKHVIEEQQKALAELEKRIAAGEE